MFSSKHIAIDLRCGGRGEIQGIRYDAREQDSRNIVGHIDPFVDKSAGHNRAR